MNLHIKHVYAGPTWDDKTYMSSYGVNTYGRQVMHANAEACIVRNPSYSVWIVPDGAVYEDDPGVVLLASAPRKQEEPR